jgi:hypothetical protein
MADMLLLAFVVGTVVLAAGVDVSVVIVWLRRMMILKMSSRTDGHW